jgi:aryl carrier-like protein
VEPARIPTEERLGEIWSEVLGWEDFSANATLFEMGVDSLSVFRIAARMIERGLGLDARDLLQNPTIRGLAEYADARSEEQVRRHAGPSLSKYRNGARRQEARLS